MPILRFEKKKYVLPDSDSPCTTWKSYFQRLRKEFGKQHALVIWVDLWVQNGSASCLLNTEFNQWQKKVGLDVGNAGIDAMNSVTDLASDLVGIPGSIAKGVRIAIPVLMGLGLTYIAVKAIKGKPINPISIMPAGKVAKMMGGKA